MTRKPPSQLARLIDTAADAAAVALTRQAPANAQAMRDTLRSVLHAQWSQAFGGERIRLWTARTPQPEREARQRRVREALVAGTPVGEVAKAEGMHPGSVRKIRARLFGPDGAR